MSYIGLPAGENGEEQTLVGTGTFTISSQFNRSYWTSYGDTRQYYLCVSSVSRASGPLLSRIDDEAGNWRAFGYHTLQSDTVNPWYPIKLADRWISEIGQKIWISADNLFR